MAETGPEKKTNPLFSRFAKNTGWLIAQNVFQYVLSAVVGILAARYIGPSNFGILGYGATIMAMFTPLCSLGFNDIQIPVMLDEPERTGEVIGTALTLRTLSTSFSIVAISVIITILEPGNRLMWLVTFLQSLQLLFQVFDAVRLWFQMKLMSKFTAIGSIIGNIMCSAWRILLLARGATVEWFALTSVIQMLTNYLFVLPMFFTRAKLRLRFTLSMSKALLGRSWHFILSGFTVAVTNYFGRLVLGKSLGETELGYYNAANTVALMWLFVVTAIVDSAMPVLLRTRREAPDSFEPRYQALHLAVLGVSVCAGLGLTVLSRFVILLLYGQAYSPAIPLLEVLAWAGLFSNIGTARNIWTHAMGMQKYVKYYCFVSAGASILLNLLFCRWFGVMGVAAAAILTGAIQSLGAPMLFRETRPFIKQYFTSVRQIPAILRRLKKEG